LSRFIFEDIDRGLPRPQGVTFHALAAQRAAGAEPLRAVIMSVQAPAEPDHAASEGKGVLEGTGPRSLRSPAAGAFLPSQPGASTGASSSLSPTQAELRRMLLRGPQFAGKGARFGGILGRRFDDDGEKRIPLDIKVGDTVIYSKYGGTEVKYNGEEYLLLSARDVLAIVEK
jgi:hypothetical protein